MVAGTIIIEGEGRDDYTTATQGHKTKEIQFRFQVSAKNFSSFNLSVTFRFVSLDLNSYFTPPFKKILDSNLRNSLAATM